MNKKNKLHEAVRYNDTKKVKKLIKYDTDINIPFIFSVGHCGDDRSEIIKMLIQEKADVNIKYKNAPVLWLVTALDKETCSKYIKILLDSKTDINARDEDGQTLLHVASCIYNCEFIRELISLNADVHAKDNLGRTPLMKSCINNNRDRASVLLEMKSDVNQSEKNGKTSLMLASEKGYTFIMDLLIESKANPQQLNNENLNVLDCAFLSGNKNMVRYLLNKSVRSVIYEGKSVIVSRNNVVSEECSICAEIILNGTLLSCNHIFHADCLKKWFDVYKTCPLCRRKVVSQI